MARRQNSQINVKHHKTYNPLGKCGWPFLSLRKCNNCKHFDECYKVLESSKTAPKFAPTEHECMKEQVVEDVECRASAA